MSWIVHSRELTVGSQWSINNGRWSAVGNYNSTANCNVKFRGGAINAGRSE